MREQIFEALGAAVKAFAAGHAVFGVRAFVAFVAGENIQVCTVELDAMRGNLGEIAAYVVRCELGAQVGLVAARPACVFGHRTVCQPNRIVGIKGLRGEVVIAVLVMRAENIALLMAGVDQRLHAFPAACLLTGRQIVGVCVVVSGLCPTIQVHVQSACTHAVQCSHLLFALCEGDQRLVFLGVVLIVVVRVGLHFGFDADVHPRATNQVTHGGIARRLFGERTQATSFVDVRTIGLAHRRVIGVVEELVAYHAAIIHCAEAWLKPSIDMGVRAIAGMVDAVTGIPWSFADGDIPVSVCAELREPRHVTASRFEAAVEGDVFGAHGGRPCVGDHHTLLMGDECRVMVVGAIEVHGCGPRHIGDVQALLIERNPFEEHIA